MEIRQLREEDNRSAFRSGDPDLDRFFQKYAGQNQFRHHLGTTYIAVENENILGFATVAAGHLEMEQVTARLRRKLPQYPLPILRLARLATDLSFRQRGIGKALLRFVLTLALRMAKDYGCVGVVVDAKPDATPFYTDFGFTPLSVHEGQLSSRPLPTPMFLSVLEIEAAAGKPRRLPK